MVRSISRVVCSKDSITPAEWRENSGARLVLLHAAPLDCYVAIDEYGRYDYAALLGEQERAAQEQMRELVASLSADEVKVESAAQGRGHPGEKICDAAETQHVDLIVISSHGYTGFSHLLLGSTAEYVVRHAPCPVWIVPARTRPKLSARKVSK